MRDIKSIAGLRVISLDEGASVGIVAQVVVDLAEGTVLGLIVGSGAAERGVAVEDIDTIGSDVVMISTRSLARHISELPELESHRRAPGAPPMHVFTASGRRLGVVSSVYIDPLEKVVTRYEVSAGALRDLADGVLILPVIAGTIHGEDALILPDEALSEVREAGGLRGRLSQWGGRAREQYEQAAQKVGKAYESSAEAVKKEASAVGRQARQQYQQAAEGVGKAYESSAEVLKKEASAVGRQARQQYQQAAEGVGKAYESSAEVLKKEASAVRQQAGELTDKARDLVGRESPGQEERDGEEGAEAEKVEAESAEQQAAETTAAETPPVESETADTEPAAESPQETAESAEAGEKKTEADAESPQKGEESQEQKQAES